MNSTRVAKTTNFINNSAKFIILKVRKFRFLGWGYLILFCFFFLASLVSLYQSNLPVSQVPNLPNPPSNTNPAPDPTSIVIEGSQSKAYKTGNEVTIRWDNPVFDTSFRVDNRRVRGEDVNCQLDFCTLNLLSDQASIVQASWTENGEQFSKEFRLNP